MKCTFFFALCVVQLALITQSRAINQVYYPVYPKPAMETMPPKFDDNNGNNHVFSRRRRPMYHDTPMETGPQFDEGNNHQYSRKLRPMYHDTAMETTPPKFDQATMQALSQLLHGNAMETKPPKFDPEVNKDLNEKIADMVSATVQGLRTLCRGFTVRTADVCYFRHSAECKCHQAGFKVKLVMERDGGVYTIEV